MAPSRQWAHAAAAGPPSRALAPLGGRRAVDELVQLGNRLERGEDGDLPPLRSDNPLHISQDLDQFLPPVSRLQLEQQSAHLREARNREDSVSRPLYPRSPAAA